jgi:Zn-dependent protease
MVSEGFMFDRGFLTLATIRGMPIRVHWTMPVGALIFGGFSFAPAFWLGFFVLVLMHELGHAYFVRRYRHHVVSIEVTGFGGLCRWSGHATPFERAAIAWGGVVAQALLLVVTLALVLVLGSPTTRWAAELVHVFTTTNLLLIGLNLIPVRPLDGAEAWPLVRHLRDRFRSRPRRGPRPPSPPPPPQVSDAEKRRLAETFRNVAEQAGRARRP